MRFFFCLAAGLLLSVLAACDSAVEIGAGGGTTAGPTTGLTTGAGGTHVSSSTTTGTTTTGEPTSSSSTGTGGAAPCGIPPNPKVFEIGTGETCFEALSPNQTITVQAGPQGGFHLWLAVGCADCGDHPVIEYGVKNLATHDYYLGPLKEVVELVGAPWPHHTGGVAFLPGANFDPMSVLKKGSHVLLSATAFDKSMKPLHTDEIEVVLGDTVVWNPPCDPNPGCGAPGGLPCCNDGSFDAGPPDAGMD